MIISELFKYQIVINVIRKKFKALNFIKEKLNDYNLTVLPLEIDLLLDEHVSKFFENGTRKIGGDQIFGHLEVRLKRNKPIHII